MKHRTTFFLFWQYIRNEFIICVPWSYCDRFDKLQHETWEHCVLRHKVRQKTSLFCRTDVRESSIAPELERHSRNLGSRCLEAHWKSSNVSLYHQKLWNRYMHSFQNPFCREKGKFCELCSIFITIHIGKYCHVEAQNPHTLLDCSTILRIYLRALVVDPSGTTSRKAGFLAESTAKMLSKIEMLLWYIYT